MLLPNLVGEELYVTTLITAAKETSNVLEEGGFGQPKYKIETKIDIYLRWSRANLKARDLKCSVLTSTSLYHFTFS